MSIREEHANALRHLRLDNCELYVNTQLRSFEQAHSIHAAAQSPKKRAETGFDVRSNECQIQAGAAIHTSVDERLHRSGSGRGATPET